jgi:hypothetical protein
VGKPEIAVRQNLYALCTTIPLTILLVIPWGMSGAAVGWASYFLLSYVYFVPRVFKHCLKIPTTVFYKHLFKVLLLAAVTYGSALLFLTLHDQPTVTHIALAYLCASIAFFAAAYFFIGKELRQTLNQYFSSSINSLYYRFGSAKN